MKPADSGCIPPPVTPDFDPLDKIAELHEALDHRRLRHALIGAFAASAWGTPRATQDIDWLADVPSAARPGLTEDFRKLGYDAEWRTGGQDDPIPELLRLYPRNAYRGMRVDVLLALRAFDREALSRAAKVAVGKFRIPTICAEDLIAMKLSAGGYVDIMDVQGILRVQAGRLDGELLEISCRRLHVLTELKRLQSSA